MNVLLQQDLQQKLLKTVCYAWVSLLHATSKLIILLWTLTPVTYYIFDHLLNQSYFETVFP